MVSDSEGALLVKIEEVSTKETPMEKIMRLYPAKISQETTPYEKLVRRFGAVGV
jgi:hypothetical protein